MIDPLTFIALLPAVVLVVYICRKDRTDKEPPALLAKLLGFGALSCLPAIVVELILSAIIERLNVHKGLHVAVFGANIVGNILSQLLIYHKAVPILIDEDESLLSTAAASSTRSSMPSWSRSALPRSRT